MGSSVNRIVLALVAAVLPVMMFGQESVKPVTVCEVLANLKKFNRKPVATVRRLDCSWSLTDHTCHLAQDGCEHPVRTEAYVWPNRIMLADYWEEGMPKPPSDRKSTRLN